jgi:aminopeptidase N
MPPIPAPSDAFEGDPYLPTSGNVGYEAQHYDIDLDYRVESNRLTASVVISARATQQLERLSFDVAGLIVDKVTIDGERPKKVTSTARKLVLVPVEAIAVGAEFEVVVRYHGTPHPLRSEWGDVGWEELADGVLVASQPNGASTWFPCNDHPSDKATYDITVVCESAYAVVANGRLVTKTTSPSRSRWTFAVVEPMATYLATVQIGRYRTRELPGVILHAPAHLQRQAEVDFAPVGRMREVFDDLFGPYPFDGYSVIVTADELEIPLEAHGMAIFGRNHVDGAHGSDRLIAHELAHQWFGNSLTVKRWQHIWLHEGFACYAEWLWSEASGGATAHELARKHLALLGQQPRDIVVGDPGPKLLFDDRVYKRGALGLHAVRREIGDAAFFDGLRALTEQHRYGHVEPEDVVAIFSASPRGAGVRQLIQRWIYERPLPSLR